MSYKLQRKVNGNVIGVFDEIDKQAIEQLVANNGEKVDDYDLIEFTPVPISVEPVQPLKSDVEILVDILKSKGIITDNDIEIALGGKSDVNLKTNSRLCQ